MDLNSIVNLIHLRRYLHDVQNGYAAISKEHLRGINVKIRELDTLIIKNAVTANLTEQINRTAQSSDADFEASSQLVLKSRDSKITVSKAGVEIESSSGVTVASAPEEKSETPEAPKPVKKKRGAFTRTDDSGDSNE